MKQNFGELYRKLYDENKAELEQLRLKSKEETKKIIGYVLGFFALFIISALSLDTEIYSACIIWSVIFSALTGRKVPRPTCSVTNAVLTPLARMASSSSLVKCRPAVGAAADPTSRE